jgi:hypothetical protein
LVLPRLAPRPEIDVRAAAKPVAVIHYSCITDAMRVICNGVADVGCCRGADVARYWTGGWHRSVGQLKVGHDIEVQEVVAVDEHDLAAFGCVEGVAEPVAWPLW